MVAMRYYGNVMTTTMSQYSDDVALSRMLVAYVRLLMR